MAAHKNEKYSRIMYILSYGCTKVTRAYIMKEVRDSSPTDHIPYPWTFDDFLCHNRQNIERTFYGKKKETREKLFPIIGTTDIESWDLQMLCFIYLLLCNPSYIVEMDYEHFKKIRNKLCHTANGVLSDRDYNMYMRHLTEGIQRCVTGIQDPDLKSEMDEVIKAAETDAALQLELFMETKLNDWHDAELRALTQIEASVGRVEEGMQHATKVVTQNSEGITRLSEDGEPSVAKPVPIVVKKNTAEQQQIMKYVTALVQAQGIKVDIPVTNVKLDVKNCESDREQFLCKKIIEYLDPNIGHHADKTQKEIREAVSKAMEELLGNDITLVGAKQKCIILNLKVQCFDHLKELWRRCIDGEITTLFKKVEKLARKLHGFEIVKIEVLLTDDEFWRCIAVLVTDLRRLYDETKLTKISTPIRKKGRLQASIKDKLSPGKGSYIEMSIQPESVEQLDHILNAFETGKFNENLHQVSELLKSKYKLSNLTIEAELVSEAKESKNTNENTDNIEVLAVDNTLNPVLRKPMRRRYSCSDIHPLQNKWSNCDNPDLPLREVYCMWDMRNVDLTVSCPDLNAHTRVQRPDLEDNQKRWLVVGICLHSIIAPTLRQYVDQILNALYNILKLSDNIDTQTITKHLKKYPMTSKTFLNYEAINNNTTKKENTTKYDYKVQNAVDLSKLFLQTPMAKYSAFDDTCDSSALLEIITEVDTFSPIVKTSAKKVRSYICTPWAHCNFDKWDVIKYQTSFKVMYQFIWSLKQRPQIEAQLLADLTKLKTNGILFLQGATVEVLHEIRPQTSNLAAYCLKVGANSQSFSQDVYNQLDGFQNEMDTICNIVPQIELNEKKRGIAIRAITADVDSLSKTSADIETVQTKQTDLLTNVENEVAQTADQFVKLNSDQTHIQEILSVLEIKTDKVETVIDNVKTDIVELKKYTGYSRPKGKVLFYLPNRIKSFVGRKYELQLLEKNFLSMASEQYTQAISGFEGYGKTTLSIEFAWLCQSFYKGGVFWMSAENSSSLEDSIYKLAVDANSVGSSANETMYKTLKWLSMLQDRWLLVVDNVDEEELSGNVKELLLGTWKRNTKSHMIIASRRNEEELQDLLHITSKQCACLEVFTTKEGEEFMKRRTNIDSVSNDENIAELVEELGSLPLALQQAAAHIKSLKCSFKDYTDKFKKKRVFLLNLKKAKSDFATNKSRLNVMTNLQLSLDCINAQSEEEGLGSAAISLMEMSAFLFADVIPVHIINIGKPNIENDDLLEALKDALSVKQVIEILNRFSLFQCLDKERLSVHRLVQEVIRNNMRYDDSKMKYILQCALRMMNAALSATTSPYDVIAEGKDQVVKRGSLQLWSDLAVNADVLKGHVLRFAQTFDKGICTNIETTRILQTTALYNSIHQRHDQALSDQDTMLNILPTLDTSLEELEMLTCIKIPVFEKERIMIQESLASVTQNEDEDESAIGYYFVPYTTDQLRLKGNEAFREKRHQDAIQYYTEGLRACFKDTIDVKLLSNRSLVYLKIKDFEKALNDANRCIDLSPGFWKGYCWKAYAIANLVRIGVLPSTMETQGLASASVAAQLNEECLLEYKMKIYYPVLVYKMVENTDSLGKEIMDITQRSFTTLLLRKGKYSIHKHQHTICTKSIQVVGIEDGVEIDTGPAGFLMCRPSYDAFRLKYITEQNISVHFENIFFKGGQICVSDKVNATFYRCKFSNGAKGCAEFPYCTARKGCINPSECLVKQNARMAGMLGLHMKPIGQVGYAGICSTGYGKVFIDTCVMDACGGGGALCDGDNAILDIRNSTVTNMIQSGIEARNGGTVIAENNVIKDNNFHGFAIGPRGHAEIKSNTIQGNGSEGIWLGGKAGDEKDLFFSTPKETSTAIITDNVIRQNGLSGISLDGGSFEVTRNKIADNWLWGIMVKSRSSATINYNDIFKNKCGAIRIGTNYSAPVTCDGNTIRDHTGPAVYTIRPGGKIKPAKQHLQTGMHYCLKDKQVAYSKFPIITDRNVSINNDTGVQYPSKSNQLIRTCDWCHDQSKNLQKCGKCKKASYCSKDCQTQHWRIHKHRCKLLQTNYIIEIPMEKTKPFGIVPAGISSVRTFNPDLTGIKKGPPPDTIGSKRFIVKVKSSGEYSAYNPNENMLLYDQSVTLDIMFQNPALYHLVHKCGLLAGEKLSAKNIFCWAFFKQKGRVLCIHTDNLPPFQTW